MRRPAGPSGARTSSGRRSVIWERLLIAEQMFRRFDVPELLVEVAAGATYVNGVRVTKRAEEPDLVYTPIDETSARGRGFAGLRETLLVASDLGESNSRGRIEAGYKARTIPFWLGG